MSPFVLASRLAMAVASDPADFFGRIVSEARVWPERGRVVAPYPADPDWDEALHEHLGRPAPCDDVAELADLWRQVLSDMARKGAPTGPRSFLGWNDGDQGLVRAVWRLVRGLGATRVVETGVAHGVTSRFILEALSRNGAGRLWSIDLPPQLHPELHGQIGAAVDDALRANWTYIKGSSRRRLPALLHRIGPIDLFIHDSLHSTENVLFECRAAWKALRPGGAIVVDDIDANDGFRVLLATLRGYRAWVCEAEPIRPDERRANGKGYFGLLVKDASAAAVDREDSAARAVH